MGEETYILRDFKDKSGSNVSYLGPDSSKLQKNIFV